MTMSDTPRRFDVVVLGGANTDYLVRGEKLPAAGTTGNGDLFLEGPGGKGANQAVAASRLGARTAFIGCVGDDARGRVLVATLRAELVDTTHVATAASAATGAAVIQVDTRGQKQILAALGANRELTAQPVHAAAEMMKASHVLLMQLEVPLETVVAAASLAYAAGVRVVLDPAPPVQLPDSLVACIEVLRGNRSEIEAITGVHISDRESARRAAGVLFAKGVGLVVTEVGDEGNLLVSRSEEVWLPRLPVRSVDATGAGDAFSAALAVAMAERQSWPQAGVFASAAAALATTVMGAQPGLPRREQLVAYLESMPATRSLHG